MKLEAIRDNVEEILQHYPERSRPLIKHQIITMIEFMGQEKEVYQKNDDVKRIMDVLLTEVIQGKFIL